MLTYSSLLYFTILSSHLIKHHYKTYIEFLKNIYIKKRCRILPLFSKKEKKRKIKLKIEFTSSFQKCVQLSKHTSFF